MTFRPFPWQLGNPSQQIGLIGTAVAYMTLFMLALMLARNRGRIMEVGAPIIYTLAFLFVAYSLSAGNAGTAFRYRTHVVALAACVLIVLRELRLHPEEAEERRTATPPTTEPGPLPARA
jgi:hypothetical protein